MKKKKEMQEWEKKLEKRIKNKIEKIKKQRMEWHKKEIAELTNKQGNKLWRIRGIKLEIRTNEISVDVWADNVENAKRLARYEENLLLAIDDVRTVESIYEENESFRQKEEKEYLASLEKKMRESAEERKWRKDEKDKQIK